jgi:hypothetical protein
MGAHPDHGCLALTDFLGRLPHQHRQRGIHVSLERDPLGSVGEHEHCMILVSLGLSDEAEYVGIVSRVRPVIILVRIVEVASLSMRRRLSVSESGQQARLQTKL